MLSAYLVLRAAGSYFMTNISLFALYAIFAAISIALNVLTQRMVFWVHDGPNTIFFSMTGGATVALVAKYYLDRRFIFSVKSYPKASEFFRYAFTGGMITLVYFVVEYLIWSSYRTDFARDLGIVLGMAAGYGIKFFLDREYVFKEK